MSFPRYEKYKDSGVEWLGEVPEEWTVASLKHGYSIIGGSTPKSDSDTFWDGDIVWVTPADLSKLPGLEVADSARKITQAGLDSCGTSLVPSGSVILSTRAPIGTLGIAAKSLCTNQGCKALVPQGGQNSRYCVYLLLVSTGELNILGRGTTFLELSGDALGKFPFPIPPLPEQRTIAAFLDHETGKIDALVAEQEKLIGLLKEKRQAVISHAVTKGLDPNARMKDSGVEWLGEVPEGWEVVRLGNLFFEANESGNDDLPILQVSIHHGVSDRELDESEMDRKVARSEDRSKYKRVQPGDLAYNMMRAWQGGFGTVTVPGQISPAYIVARPKKHIVTEFVEHVLRTPRAVEEMRRFSRGVTDFRLRLYWDEFKNIRIAVPPLEEAEKICGHIHRITVRYDSLRNSSEQSIALLQERRTALISAAVTGKIDVRGWSKDVSEMIAVC